MGGCYSTPKELDGPTVEKPAEPGVTVKPVGGLQGNAPTEVQAEPATEPEIEEHPLVDLSEPNPEDERDEVHVVLSPEISGLMVDTPEGNENETVKDAPVAEQAIVTEQKGNVAEEKPEEAEKLEEKVSAPRGNGDMRS